MPGWMGDLSALINKLLSTSLQTGCHETLHNQEQLNVLCALCAFVNRPQSWAPQVTQVIWYSAYKKYICWTFWCVIYPKCSHGSPITNIEWVCFFWQMFVFVGLNVRSKKRTVGSLWEVNLSVCKQRQEYYSLLWHSNFISWMPPIKRHCSL